MGRGSLILLTSCCTWVSGDPVDFLTCLFLTHEKALCPGDSLTSSSASSAACCQVVFTGQFISPCFSTKITDCKQYLPLGSCQFIPPSFWCLSKIPKLRVWVPLVVSEKRRWIARSSSQNLLKTVVFSVDSWGSLRSSISYLSSVLEGKWENLR